MSEKIQITLIGKDDVLAAVLAEQAKGQMGGVRDFDFMVAVSVSEASPASDVWVLPRAMPVPALEQMPLCIRIANADEAPQPSDDIVFIKPFRLAQLLDVMLSGAKLRRRKQPRALGDAHVFHPFARLVEATASGQNVSLTEKEASFLCAVLDAGQNGLSRKDAMTELWGYHPDAESHAVDTTLYRLRQKLQELGSFDAHLVNEGGVYKWCD
ncbi:MAG: winged helix-turn-helix domain-containing protein [Alphaproteobacteria bacterium]|nr:winged helix-turn-helix domain-containing protein [Alphaproteobacteria bacterium]